MSVRMAKKEKKLEVIDGGKTIDNLLKDVRENYKRLQFSWVGFAKSLHEFKEQEAWSKLEGVEYNSFQHFCVSEFPELNPSLITRLIHAYQEFGAKIEERLKKFPDSQVPSLEVCYQFSRIKDRIDQKEVLLLQKKVLNREMFLDDVKNIIKKKEFVEKEEELVEDEEEEKEVDEKETEETVDDVAIKIYDQIKPARKLLPYLTNNVEVSSKEIVKLARLCVKVSELMNEFVARVEEVASDKNEKNFE